MTFDTALRCGWVDNQEWVQRVVADLPMPLISGASEAGTADDWKTRDVLLWEAEFKVLGELLPAHFQYIGSCVGHGWTRLAQDAILWAIGSGQAMEWPGELSVAVNYAGSRVEIGGGKLRGDGSVGAWAAQWVSKFGVLPKKLIAGINLDVSGEAEDELARRWGRPGAGVPDVLEPEAKLHPIETVSLADDIDTALGLLANGYAGAMCSNLAFQTVRNNEGICEFNPRDKWPHCMEVRGVCRLKSGDYVVAIQQSWGNNPTGPNKVTLYSGREVTLPEGVFFIRLDPFAKGIAAKDTFFGSGVKGFPRRPIDWMLFSR